MANKNGLNKIVPPPPPDGMIVKSRKKKRGINPLKSLKY